MASSARICGTTTTRFSASLRAGTTTQVFLIIGVSSGPGSGPLGWLRTRRPRGAPDGRVKVTQASVVPAGGRRGPRPSATWTARARRRRRRQVGSVRRRRDAGCSGPARSRARRRSGWPARRRRRWRRRSRASPSPRARRPTGGGGMFSPRGRKKRTGSRQRGRVEPAARDVGHRDLAQVPGRVDRGEPGAVASARRGRGRSSRRTRRAAARRRAGRSSAVQQRCQRTERVGAAVDAGVGRRSGRRPSSVWSTPSAPRCRRGRRPAWRGSGCRPPGRRSGRPGAARGRWCASSRRSTLDAGGVERGVPVGVLVGEQRDLVDHRRRRSATTRRPRRRRRARPRVRAHGQRVGEAQGGEHRPRRRGEQQLAQPVVEVGVREDGDQRQRGDLGARRARGRTGAVGVERASAVPRGQAPAARPRAATAWRSSGNCATR